MNGYLFKTKNRENYVEELNRKYEGKLFSKYTEIITINGYTALYKRDTLFDKIIRWIYRL